jgi:hypothetical protein
MKRMGVAGLCLVSVLALSASMAVSASAVLPEFTGPFPKTFTATSKGSRLETVSGIQTKCTGDTAFGEITGAQNGSMTITFTGCKLKKVPCNTPGATPGTIATNSLSMKMYYVNKAKKAVGIDLVEASGAPFLEYGCGSATFARVVGSVIGRIKPVNKLVTPSETFVLRFVQNLGVQKIANLEGGPIDVLETSFGGPFEGTGLESTDFLLFGEPVALLA